MIARRRKVRPPPHLFCCACAIEVTPRLTTGAEVYPHRSDLFAKKFWRCQTCGNYVGCHAGTDKPLGNIPTEELRKARNHIHALLDPLWKRGMIARGDLYSMISGRIGRTYHTGEIMDIPTAREVYRIVLDIKRNMEEDARRQVSTLPINERRSAMGGPAG